MKIDFHTHSKYSIDSLTNINNIYKQAKKRGLDGIALTDHNEFRGVQEFKKILREERDKNFILVPGMELKIDKGEILALFLEEPIKSRKLQGVIQEAKAQGALLCLPHPFDKIRRVVPRVEKMSPEQLKAIDCVEVFNGRMLDQKANQLALKFAEKNHKAQLGGSDAHWWFEVGNAYTKVNGSTLEEVKHELKRGRCKAFGTPTNPAVLGLTKGVKIVKKAAVLKWV